MRYLSLLLTASIIASPIALGQSILTIAGGGTDDGRPATDVGLSEPRGMTFDQNGNLLITERDNNKVRRVDLTTGVISTVAGNSSNIASRISAMIPSIVITLKLRGDVPVRTRMRSPSLSGSFLSLEKALYRCL